ncbi:MAG: orotidine-5'-phosphate decarboxylase [Bacteroidetes bacterium]|jgi:orotidine-5'-phosphate decarboxylase|nr:orotidine-5'-phosphate decarboxylase [Bacteroidota bacterium]
MNKKELVEQIKRKRSFLCVGLDTDSAKIPHAIIHDENAVFQFNKRIIDATAPYAVAYKPNTAFYENEGASGWVNLEKTIHYIKATYPEMLVIADAKRGDIGNTSWRYASAFFEQLKADAITVAPYMGYDSVEPFLGFEDKWVILLGLTSNTGSADFQQLKLENGNTLFEEVVRKACSWASSDQLMFVAGATQPAMIRKIRTIAPEYFFLVPGVGAQGGDLAEVAEAGFNTEVGLLVNASRSILYASNSADFAEAAAAEAKSLQSQMELLLIKNKLL